METGIYEFVIAKLEDCKGSWPSVAHESGVSKRTIEKIARKEIEDPGVKKVQMLFNYFTKASQ